MSRALLYCALAQAVLVGTGAARAQEAIATAPSGLAPQSSVVAAPLSIIPPLDDGVAAPIFGPCGGVIGSTDGRPVKPDNSPHGQVWAGVGSQSSYDVGGVVCTPIKDKGSVTIAVDRAQVPGGAWVRR